MTGSALACPFCRTWFESEEASPRCPACGRRFPAEGGVLGRGSTSTPITVAKRTPEADLAAKAHADWHCADALGALGFLAIGVLLLWLGLREGLAAVVVIGAAFAAVAAASGWLSSFWQHYESLSGDQSFLVRLPAQAFKWTFWGVTALFYIASCSG